MSKNTIGIIVTSADLSVLFLLFPLLHIWESKFYAWIKL